MLAEIPGARQFPGEPGRRWFTDEAHDLWVWLDGDGRPRGFQFCYGKRGVERALTWRPERGFVHHRVDTGHAGKASLGAPLLMLREGWNVVTLAGQFRRVADRLPPDIVAFVEDRLRQAQLPPHRRRRPAGRRRRR